ANAGARNAEEFIETDEAGVSVIVGALAQMQRAIARGKIAEADIGIHAAVAPVHLQRPAIAELVREAAIEAVIFKVDVEIIDIRVRIIEANDSLSVGRRDARRDHGGDSSGAQNEFFHIGSPFLFRRLKGRGAGGMKARASSQLKF